MTTEIAAQRRINLFSPPGIALIIGGIFVLWSLMRTNPTVLVLVAVAVLFLVGLKRPVWAMVAMLVSQLTVTSYIVTTPIGSISLRLLLLTITFLVMAREFILKQVDLGPHTRRLLIPILTLIGITIIANLVNSGFDFAFKDLRNMVVGLLIVVLLPAVVKDIRDLKIICGVILIVTITSAIIGIAQFFQILGMEQATILPGILTTTESRIPGMGESYLELAYILSITPITLIGVYMASSPNSSYRKWIPFVVILMLIALYFTYTRSALYAIVLGGLALLFFLKTRVSAQTVLGVALLAVAIIEITGLLGGLQFGGRSESSQEESSLSRSILWQAGIDIAIDNPVLGIGGDQFSTVSPQYAEAVDPLLLEYEEEQYYSYRTLGSEQPHNDFLNVWVSYGTLALLAYVWIYFRIVGNFANSYQTSRRRFLRGLSVGLAAALVVYGVNAFYHNLMNTLPLLWILAGLSLVTGKLAVREMTQVSLPSGNKRNTERKS